MSNQQPAVIDAASGLIEDIPPSKGNRYRCKLDTLADVKREMARVYRESRSELIDPQAGTKLVWMLQSIAKVIETGDIEKRLENLEEKMNDHKE